MFGLKITRKRDVFEACFGKSAPRAPLVAHGAIVQTSASTITDIPSYTRVKAWTGEKFPGGIGTVDILATDYWTLRQLSATAWKRGMYARGIIRRLVTNIVNTGLHLEATPEEAILGVPEGSLEEWSELVEKRFELWSDNAQLCDRKRSQTFGEQQATALTEALIVGDVLCMLDIDQMTGLPLLRLENGAHVRTPMGRVFDRPGVNRVIEGVEVDAAGAHVAYHVLQENGTSKRIPAWGPKSKRRIAWLLYGTDKRSHETRGEPLLSLVLQSLSEIERYRESTSRKAVLSSMIALVKERTQPGIPSAPLSNIGGAPALRKGLDTTEDTHGNEVSYNSLELIPGIIIEGLKEGETIKALGSQGTDEKFGDFEEAIIRSIAWHFEVPPEILCLAFSHNYSASQAANNEFALFLKKARNVFACQLCQPIYIEWLIAEVASGKVQAAQFLESRRIPSAYDIVGAWLRTDWAGQIKPAADVLKVVNAEIAKLENGLTTYSRSMRELSGMKFTRAVKQIAKERKLLEEAGVLPTQQAAPEGPPAQPDSEEPDDEEREDEEREQDQDGQPEARALWSWQRRKAS